MAHSNASSLSYVAVSPGPVRVPGNLVTDGGTRVVQECLHCHHYVYVVPEDESVCQLTDVSPEASYVS